MELGLSVFTKGSKEEVIETSFPAGVTLSTEQKHHAEVHANLRQLFQRVSEKIGLRCAFTFKRISGQANEHVLRLLPDIAARLGLPTEIRNKCPWQIYSQVANILIEIIKPEKPRT